MILLVRKNNILLVVLAFVLLAVILSLNINVEDSDSEVVITKVEDAKTVIIDAGHGGEDPGKVSGYSGLKEKDINLLIAVKTKELLASDFNVIMTREEDKLAYEEGTTEIFQKRKQDLTRRKQIMDESGGIVVSIHANSFPESKYYGAQTFYPPDSAESRKLAELLQASIRKNIDPNNKREPQLKSDPIVILKDLKAPTVVIECGFLSNQGEEARLATDEYQSKIAAAIAEGIRNYYK